MHHAFLRRSVLALALSLIAAFTLPAQVLKASDVPAAVLRGLDAYKRAGAQAAVAGWLAGSPATNDSSNIPRMVESLESVSQAYGKMSGYDLLRVTQVGSRVRRVYVVILFEKGALYALFECYQAPNEWIVSSFLTNLRASEILPADLLGGPR
jgi:hypothetical protein